MKILGLDHVVIRCTDAAAMTRFYCEALGCAVDKINDELGLIHLRAGASLVDLITVSGKLGRAGGAAQWY